MNWQSREDERVARALDSAGPHERADRVAVAIAERLRAVPPSRLDADPAFARALRARLLAEGAALLPHPRVPGGQPEPEPAEPVRPAGPVPHVARPGRRATRAAGRRRRALAAGTVLAAAALSAGAIAVSSGALPGDPLYGLKRKVQDAETVLAQGDAERGERHLDLARTRVLELTRAEPDDRAGPLVATLDDMDTETRLGMRMLATVAVRRTDEARLVLLGAWTGEQRGLLTRAATDLPGAAHARAAVSQALLTDVSVRLRALRGSLRCECPTSAPVDELGPLPCAGCDALAPVAQDPEPADRTGAGPVRVPVPAPTATTTPPPVRVPAPPPPAPTAPAPAPAPTPPPAGPGGQSRPAPKPPAMPAPPVIVPPEETARPAPEPIGPAPPLPAPPPAPAPAPDGAITGLLDGVFGAFDIGRPRIGTP